MIWQWAASIFVPTFFIAYCASHANKPYPWNDETLDKINEISGTTALFAGMVAIIAFIWSFGS